MPGEELLGMPPAATVETQTAPQPAESAPDLPQAPAVEQVKALKALLLKIRNALSGKKSSPAPKTQPPPAPPEVISARDAAFPPVPQAPSTPTK